ncbi:MAG: SIS domain-containing protein [Intestinimonas sp.]
MIRESRRGADGSTSPASESRAMWPAIWPPAVLHRDPAYFLHGTEAVHGSCGQLVAGDVVICISNSGETAELKATVIAVKNNGCKVIGVTGDPGSWLARNSDLHLLPGWGRRGPLNRAPRSSILAELLTLQALSVALQADCGQTPADYVRCHPGGKLGQLREGRELKMLTGACIHPDLMRVLSLCGHGDKVLIADGNYPLASCPAARRRSIWG